MTISLEWFLLINFFIVTLTLAEIKIRIEIVIELPQPKQFLHPQSFSASSHRSCWAPVWFEQTPHRLRLKNFLS